jgi:glycosyltransferase involved in cell wall biosynthesis
MMKKILVFIDWYLPGYKAGGPVRSMANMIACLKENYQFHVVCLNTDYLEKTPYPEIRTGEWNKLSENEFVCYIPENELSVKLVKKVIAEKDYELVYINGIYSFYFSILPLIYSKRLKIQKIVVAPRGMFSQQAFTAKKLKKKLFLAFARISGLYKNIVFHVTSKSEEIDILKLKPGNAGVILLPNLPPVAKTSIKENTGKQKGELKLVSIARISPEKNTLFALQVLKEKPYQGKIFLDLYGPVYDKPYWKKCLEVISAMPENISVVYKGTVINSQVEETLRNYHFLFLPSAGENFGHSILESFIAGVPVIISNLTPWKNLEEKGLGWDYELNKDLFASAIRKSLDMTEQSYRVLKISTTNFAAEITDMRALVDSYKSFFG